MKIDITKKSQKELDALPHKDRDRLKAAIQELASTPVPHSAKRLSWLTTQQDEPLYSMRQGKYRVIYSYSTGTKTILVRRISMRKESYANRDFGA